MLINNVNINSFGAKQLTVDIQAGQLNNTNTWSRKFLTPVFNTVNTTFSTLEVELMITGTNREDCLIKANNIIALCIKNKANTIVLDKYNRNFIGSLIEHKETKTKGRFTFKQTLKFQGYVESKETYTKEITSSGTITNNSTTKTACKLIIMSKTVDIASIKIKINDREITVNNLTKTVPIILNGLNGEFTEQGNNKFNDIDLWELPYLDIGGNTITCNNSDVVITVEYKERYI